MFRSRCSLLLFVVATAVATSAEIRFSADPAKPIYRGHDLPRLRGAMAGTHLTEADIEYFAGSWGGNLLRWQLFEAARTNRPLDEYDSWLNVQLEYFDQALHWCRKHGILIVLDLHSPPGGEAFSAGYVTARGDIFRKPEARAKFVEVWQKMARRFRVHLFVGEFSAIRIAPEGSAARYLADTTELFEELGYDWTYHAYREWHGWSLEHEGSLQDSRKASQPTDRELIVTRWFKLNQRPVFN